MNNAILIDLTYDALVKTANELQVQRNLSTSDMENILCRVLNDFKTRKSIEYANDIISLTYALQEKDKMLAQYKESEVKEERHGESV